MDEAIGGAIIGAIVGAVVGGAVGVVMLVLALLRKPKPCAECGAPAPKVRKPANRRQMLWGGWTCPECGCEMDRRGRKIEE
jgi:hypothetical protein